MPPSLVLSCVWNCLSDWLCSWGWPHSSLPHLTDCTECQVGFTYISKENENRNTFENSVRYHIFCLFVCLVKGSHLDLLTLWHHLTLFLVPQESVKRRSAIGLSISGYAWLRKQGWPMHTACHPAETHKEFYTPQKKQICLDWQGRQRTALWVREGSSEKGRAQ